MLEVKNLFFSYKSVQALQDVSIKVDRGITAILGSNGSGKTTLLYNIMGVLKPQKGKIIWNNKDITKYQPYERVNEGITLVPEGRKLFLNMTVHENLKAGAYTKNARKDLNKTLEMVYTLFPKLKERQNQSVNTMSGGEQQMVAIARALMSNPSLLMLDEPLAGLQPSAIPLIMNKLQELTDKGLSILLVEQNVNIALKYSNYGYVLENGRITLEGTSSELQNNQHVRKAYLGL